MIFRGNSVAWRIGTRIIFIWKVAILNFVFSFSPFTRYFCSVFYNNRLKELRSWSLLKELGLYVLFLLCLSTVTYRNKNPMSFEINKTMKDLFLFGADGKEKSFEQVMWNLRQRLTFMKKDYNHGQIDWDST